MEHETCGDGPDGPSAHLPGKGAFSQRCENEKVAAQAVSLPDLEN